MRSFLKWTATVLGVLALAVLISFGLAWIKTERAMARTYTVNDPPLTMRRDAATLAHGQHVFATRGERHDTAALGVALTMAIPAPSFPASQNLTPAPWAIGRQRTSAAPCARASGPMAAPSIRSCPGRRFPR